MFSGGNEVAISSLRELAADTSALDLGLYLLLVVLAPTDSRPAVPDIEPPVKPGHLIVPITRLCARAKLEWGELRDALERLVTRGKIVYAVRPSGTIVEIHILGYPGGEDAPAKKPKVSKGPIVEFQVGPGASLLANVSEKVQRAWIATYHGDLAWIRSELNKAYAWVEANPRRKKKDYGRFLTNWLSTASKGYSNRPPQKPRAPGLILTGKVLEE